MKAGETARRGPGADPLTYTGLRRNATDRSVPKSGFRPTGIQVSPSGGFAWDIPGSVRTVFCGGLGVNYLRKFENRL